MVLVGGLTLTLTFYNEVSIYSKFNILFLKKPQIKSSLSIKLNSLIVAIYLFLAVISFKIHDSVFDIDTQRDVF